MPAKRKSSDKDKDRRHGSSAGSSRATTPPLPDAKPPQPQAPEKPVGTDPALVSVLLSQPSTAASFEDDTFVKLLLAEDARGVHVAVRKGLANAIHLEESPSNPRSGILVDFLAETLRFCRSQCFTSVQTAECLKLLERTRKSLAEHPGDLDAVKEHFQGELVILTRRRLVTVREIQYIPEEIVEAIPPEEDLAALSASQTKAKSPSKERRKKERADGKRKGVDSRGGSDAEESPPPTTRKRTIIREVPSEKQVLCGEVFKYDDCVAIIDYTATTLFQHHQLYAYVFSQPQQLNHLKKEILVYDAFPPQPLATAMKQHQYDQYTARQQAEMDEATARGVVEVEELSCYQRLVEEGSQGAEAIRGLHREWEEHDKAAALGTEEFSHSIRALNFRLRKDHGHVERELAGQLARVEKSVNDKLTQEAADLKAIKASRRVLIK